MCFLKFRLFLFSPQLWQFIYFTYILMLCVFSVGFGLYCVFFPTLVTRRQHFQWYNVIWPFTLMRSVSFFLHLWQSVSLNSGFNPPYPPLPLIGLEVHVPVQDLKDDPDLLLELYGWLPGARTCPPHSLKRMKDLGVSLLSNTYYSNLSAHIVNP